MVDTTGFVTALVLNAAIALVGLGLFLAWREKHPWCFDARRDPRRRHTGNEPPSISPGAFGWLAQTVRLSDAEVLDTAGLDAVMYVKFFEMCARLFVALSVLGIGVLLPVNFTAPARVSDPFDRMSMANVGEGSPRFWAHLLMAYAFSACFYGIVWRVWREYAQLRQRYLIDACTAGGAVHTILVRNLPPACAKSDDALFAYFERLFPGEIRSARLVKDLTVRSFRYRPDVVDLSDVVRRRKEVVCELERAVAVWRAVEADTSIPERQKEAHRPMKALRLGCLNKVDAIDHLIGELEELNDAVEKKQALDAEGRLPTLPSGFVTFVSSKTAAAAVSYKYDSTPYTFDVTLAPEWRDVQWANLGMTHTQRRAREWTFGLLTAALTFLWMIPMGFLQGLSNLKELSQYWWLAWVTDIPDVVLGFIQAYLPAILLIVFFILVPIILRAFSTAQGLSSRSDIQSSTLDKFWLFILVNFFFGAIIGSSILSDAPGLFSNLSNVPTVLGQTIPKVANYFTTYIALASLAGFPLQLAQVDRVLIGGAMKLFAKTPREVAAAESPPELDYGVAYANHLFIFVIAITYAFISPIILPFAAVYFLLGWLVFKHQLVHVFVQPAFEAGGAFWPRVYTKLSTCLFIGQLCLVGIFGLKQVPAQATLVLPLPVLTLLFDRFLKETVRDKAEALTLEEMVQIDAKRREEGRAPRSAQQEKRHAAQQSQQESKDIDPPSVVRSSVSSSSSTSVDLHPLEVSAAPETPVPASSIAKRDVSSDAVPVRPGLPYAPTEQHRLAFECDVGEYIQPELTSCTPARIRVEHAAEASNRNERDNAHAVKMDSLASDEERVQSP